MSSPDGALVQARLRLACEAAQLGLWDWDLATDALVWDERSVAMYGLSGVALSGRVSDIERSIHPEDLAAVQAALGAAIEAAGVVDVDFRVLWPDGQVRWVYARGQALVDTSGAVVRVIGTNADVTDQRRAVQQQADDARRMASLVAVAQALGTAESEAEVLAIVAGRGTALLEAQGAALCLVQAGDRHVRTLLAGLFASGLHADVAELPDDFPLPMVHTATTGTAHFLDDRAAAAAAFPGSEELYERAGTEGSAAVPLRTGEEVLGSLVVAFDRPHPWRSADQELLEAFAALTTQALERLRARDAERAAARAVQGFSEALQRSLLTHPAQPGHLQIVVRYTPAAAEAQVGGDWYDAFVTREGRTSLVIGDVSGHDQQAAAAMGQLRNVLRGIGYAVGEPPAAVLSTLDRAAHDLGVDALATMVLAQVEQDPARARTGAHTLRWSNAGHPPPVLVAPDGAVRVLDTEPDLLIGLDPGTARHDHTAVLGPGSTVLLFTDGLVERRGTSLDAGLAWLTQVLGPLAGLELEALVDALLALLPDGTEDDVALLAVRTRL